MHPIGLKKVNLQSMIANQRHEWRFFFWWNSPHRSPIPPDYDIGYRSGPLGARPDEIF